MHTKQKEIQGVMPKILNYFSDSSSIAIDKGEEITVAFDAIEAGTEKLRRLSDEKGLITSFFDKE